MANNNLIKLVYYGDYKITTIIDDNTNVWFKAKDIADILEYKNTDQAIRVHVHKNNKKKCSEIVNDERLLQLKNNTNNYKNIIFINHGGVEHLLINSNKPNSIDIAKKLGINVLQKIPTKEQEIICNLKKVLDENSIKYQPQYPINNKYKVDLFLLDANIAIEIDEYGHKNYNNEDEKEIENIIKQKYKLLRFNPDDANFCIFKMIGIILREFYAKS